MRLIDREAAIEAIRDLQLDPSTTQYIYSSDAIDAVKKQPAVDAVPLEPLCEWLGNFANPCKIGIRCYYPDDNDYDCMPTVECWRYVLTKWMEGKDGTD